MIIHILWEMFGWPSGNVLGNLIASAIVALSGIIWGVFRLSKLIKRNHREHMDLARKRHEEVMQSVNGYQEGEK